MSEVILIFISPFILLFVFLIIDIGFYKKSKYKRPHSKVGVVFNKKSGKFETRERHGYLVYESRYGRVTGYYLGDVTYFEEE